MSAELDMTQYLGLFLQEAEEQLEVLEQELLKLESEPTTERMNAIFRAAHTLKGSSRAMGFANMAGVTHEMENVLDALRGGTLALNTAIADALLRCLDTLGEVRDSVATTGADSVDAAALVAELQTFLSGAPAEAVPSAPSSEAPAPVLADDVRAALADAAEVQTIYHAHFVLHADCVMKFVRAFMAINVVSDGGELLSAVPDPEALEEEKFDRRFDLYFTHADSEALLRSKFAGIAEVSEFDIRPWDPEAVPGAAKAPESANPTAEAPMVRTSAASAAATVATEAATPTPGPKKPEAAQTVRVDVARLDELMNLVGELVIDRTRVAQIGAALAARYQNDDNVDALAETLGHITRITGDLQDQLMKARMLPIETVFNRFPRMVRDLANKLGKEVRLDLVGGDTELDRSVIEVIGDPLIHILRNSVDHGIEGPDERERRGKPRAGTVTVSARHEENHIVIEIRDDGAGIDHQRIRRKAVETGALTQEAADRLSDKEALQLIFSSGLSTASEVTEVSGRGVGMDIVRSNIQRLGGLIDLDTTVGEGSRFLLRLPLTLAIIRGLLVKVSGVVYVLPLGSVVETLLVQKEEVQSVNQREVVVIRGNTTPLVRLREVFTSRNFTEEPPRDIQYVVIVGLAEQRVGLIVDSLVGEQEVVIKSMSRFCGDVRGISGATILGNGNVALIVDVNGVLDASRS